MSVDLIQGKWMDTASYSTWSFQDNGGSGYNCGLTCEEQVRYLDKLLGQENIGGLVSMKKVLKKWIIHKNVCWNQEKCEL
jgi:hypothetical protein